jgi:hypothetical protein
MKLDPHPPRTAIDEAASDLLDPLEIINAMLDLRTQRVELEEQIKALEPAFYAACVTFDLEKISLDRATISRRLTPGLWDYSADILEQENLLKQLRQQFSKPMNRPAAGKFIG